MGASLRVADNIFTVRQMQVAAGRAAWRVNFTVPSRRCPAGPQRSERYL